MQNNQKTKNVQNACVCTFSKGKRLQDVRKMQGEEKEIKKSVRINRACECDASTGQSPFNCYSLRYGEILVPQNVYQTFFSRDWGAEGTGWGWGRRGIREEGCFRIIQVAFFKGSQLSVMSHKLKGDSNHPCQLAKTCRRSTNITTRFIWLFY